MGSLKVDPSDTFIIRILTDINDDLTVLGESSGIACTITGTLIRLSPFFSDQLVFFKCLFFLT